MFPRSEVVTNIDILHNSIQHYSFICAQLNGSKYCYVSLTIQLNLSHLFALSGEAPVLELWNVLSSFSLLLLPSSMCDGVVVTERAPSMGQINMFENY